MKNQMISKWFKEYSNDIYHFLIYRLGSSDVDDLLQDVFVKAWNGFDLFEGNASPKTWLYSIARNVAMDELRKRSRWKWRRFVQLEGSDLRLTSERTPETMFVLDEENREIFQIIQTLKENYRDVIILRGIKSLTVQETAEILQWSENKVRSTYHRAKIALKKKLGGKLND